MTTLRDKQKALRDEADALEEAATEEEQRLSLIVALEHERDGYEFWASFGASLGDGVHGDGRTGREIESEARANLAETKKQIALAKRG